MRMHGEARYHPDDLSDITDRTLLQIDKTLRVTNTWVVFARQRSDNFFINDLVKLKEAVEESEDLPGPARRLVTQPSTTSPYVSPITAQAEYSLTPRFPRRPDTETRQANGHAGRKSAQAASEANQSSNSISVRG